MSPIIFIICVYSNSIAWEAVKVQSFSNSCFFCEYQDVVSLISTTSRHAGHAEKNQFEVFDFAVLLVSLCLWRIFLYFAFARKIHLLYLNNLTLSLNAAIFSTKYRFWSFHCHMRWVELTPEKLCERRKDFV